MNGIQIKYSIGQILQSISSSFGSFTADHFKNWTNFFSLFSLHNHLVYGHWKYWRKFMMASRILSQRQVTVVS